MSSNEAPEGAAAPESGDSEQRRERMLAYHAGALSDEELSLIKGRLETDAEWQRASVEAQAMLQGLTRDGAGDIKVPDELGLKASRKLQRSAPQMPAGSKARFSAPGYPGHRLFIRRGPVRKPAEPPAPVRLPILPLRWVAAVLIAGLLPVLYFVWSAHLGGPSSTAILWRPETELAAGGDVAPFLLVRDAQTQRPVAGVTVRAKVVPENAGLDQAIEIGSATTNEAGGTSDAGWKVPDLKPGKYRLMLEAASGSRIVDRAEGLIAVARSARLVLSPDRTQARPGETLRIRTLLVSMANQKPIADQQVVIELLDPAGNRIGRAEQQSSRFGLAWTEFPLDECAPEGSYKLRAQAAGLQNECTIDVKQYRLPPFDVKLILARPYLHPGEPVRGQITARTFDGAAIAGITGKLRLLEPTGGTLVQAEVALDDKGCGEFGLSPPQSSRASAVGTLEATLVDPAGRSASGRTLVRFSATPYLIDVVPEANELVPGVQNCVYVMVRKPNGQPAPGVCLRIQRGGRMACEDRETDEHGMTLFYFSQSKQPAEVLKIYASAHAFPVAENDVAGVRAQSFTLPVRAESAGQLLLRMEKVVFAPGEQVTVRLFAGEGCTDPSAAVALALRTEGRTVASASVALSERRGEATLNIPSGVSGLLHIEAMLKDKEALASDQRAILVRGGSGVKVVATADRPGYRPGETANLSFAVTDAAGNGAAGALSVVAVDQALLALTGEHGGLAQALDAASRVAPVTSFPLDAFVLSPAEGENYAACAALAALSPPARVPNQRSSLDELVAAGLLDKATVNRLQRFVIAPQTDEDRQTGEAIVAEMREEGLGRHVDELLGQKQEKPLVDHASAKQHACREHRHKATAVLYQALMALAWMLVLLALLAFVGSGSAESVAVSIPAVTLSAILFGLFLNKTVERAGALFLASVVFALHGLLLARYRQFIRDWRLPSATLCADAFLLFVLWLCLSSQSRDWQDYAGVFVCSALGASFIQYLIPARPEQQFRMGFLKAALSIAFVTCIMAAIAIPSLLRSRMAANSTAGAASIQAFAEAQEIYRRSHPVDATAVVQTASASLPPRLRTNFQEAMLFVPELVTDEQGRASYHFTVADSLTSWRICTDAIAAKGGTGCVNTSLVVTQPFSVDVQLPSDVTAGDVLVVSAIVSNFTEMPLQTEVAVELTGAKVLDGSTRRIGVPARSVAAVDFRLSFPAPCMAAIKVLAQADAAAALPPGENADAVERFLKVVPEGRPIAFSASSLLSELGQLDVTVPEDAMPGTLSSTLRVHRGPLTQMIEGLESMLHEPHGCFEQTSSTTYPNIMVLRYLRARGMSKPEIEQQAQRFIAKGYQRLLGFEVGSRSGSFSLYGQAPASNWLTAYGLLEFSDMAAVYAVDPELLRRIKSYLSSQVVNDGSVADFSGRANSVAATAYVVMALGQDAPRACVNYLGQRRATIENDPYLCALCALALSKCDRALAGQLASRLRGLARVEGDGRRAVLPGAQTISWGYGQNALVEATALGALALLETGQDMGLAQQFLAGLQSCMQPGGAWGSTHATVFALKALERGSLAGGKAGPARVIVELNGTALDPIELPAEESATPSVTRLQLPKGKSALKVRIAGGPVALCASGQACVPWSDLKAPQHSALSAEIRYDRTQVARNELVLGTLRLRPQRQLEVPMIEWGLPAGFSPSSEDLEGLKQRKAITRWELSGRRLRLYLPDGGQESVLNVRFCASSRGQLTAHTSRVYEYYRSHEALCLAPAKFEVK